MVMVTSPVMTWEEANDPDPGDTVVYTVYLDDNTGFIDADSMETSETGIYPPFCTPGTNYYWKVKAADSFGYITWSDVFNFYLHPDAGPRPPLWITITTQSDDILLEWEEVPGADSYNVHHSNDPYSGFTLLQDNVTSQEFLHEDALITFDQHFYYIIAEDTDLRCWQNLSNEEIKITRHKTK